MDKLNYSFRYISTNITVKTLTYTGTTMTKKNPFEIEQKVYETFREDVYEDVALLGYRQADLPPGPLATTNDPVPSVQFLFGGYARDEDGNIKIDDAGNKIVVRKWTSWLRISNAKNAKILKVFNGFDNLFEILQSCETSDGKLWNTPMKILLNKEDDYQNIISVKPGKNAAILDEIFYDKTYVPYKICKAYGKPVMLTLAACKFSDGVKTYMPDEMAEPSSTDN